MPEVLKDIPMLTTTKVPTTGGAGTESQIFAGDWSKLLIGVRTDIRIEVLKERFSDNMQYGFIAFMRADVAAEQEAAFTLLDAITPG